MITALKLRGKWLAWLARQVDHRHCKECGRMVIPHYEDYDFDVCTACYMDAVAKPKRGRPRKRPGEK